MTKLDKLIELNSLETQNRRNRLEDKSKQQENYGEIEELFDPVTKTLNVNSEHNLALSEQTLRAIDWQNQELNKQTKMIENIRLARNKTSNEAIEETRDRPGIKMDKDTALINHLMAKQSNPQLKLLFVNLDIGEFKMNDVKVFYQEKAFIVRDNIYEFSNEFINFLTNPKIRYDEIDEDKNKIKRFLLDIG